MKKNAIVIGASSGIGRALAKVLNENGYNVGITGRREELLKELAGELSGDVFVQRMDVANNVEAIEFLEKLIEKMGGVDLIVVNSGVGFRNADLDWQLEKSMIDINVTGFAAMANAAIKYFLKKGSGHLVGVSSIMSLRGNWSTYGASKAFVANYMDMMRMKALRARVPVTVTDIRPGFVDTDMVKGGKMFWVASPRKAAEQMFGAIKKKRSHAYITKRWSLIAWALMLFPDSFFEKLFWKARSAVAKSLCVAMLAASIVALAHPVCFAEAPAITVAKQVDGEIPAATSGAIHAINSILFQSMKDNKPNIMMNMFVEEGRTDKKLEAGVKATYDKLGNLAKGTAFKVMHEYLIEAKGSGATTVTLPGDGGNDFIINVDAGKGPLYMSLMTSSGNFNDLILCFVYLKVKNNWQLFSFHCGLYRVAGKTAVQWYEEAVQMYDKGWEVPAMQRMQLVQTFIRPAPFMQYSKEAEMRDFLDKGIDQTWKEYKFPFKATWVKGMPKIYGLDMQFIKGRLVPVVIYVTKYPLNNGVSIQDEADAITSKIGKLIPGIDKTSGEIAYRIFSEPPVDSKKQYKYRSLTSKIK